MSTKEWIIAIILFCCCSALAHISSEMQSTVDAIYTATYFGFAWIAAGFIMFISYRTKKNARSMRGLRCWKDEELDELEERVRKLEEKRY